MRSSARHIGLAISVGLQLTVILLLSVVLQAVSIDAAPSSIRALGSDRSASEETPTLTHGPLAGSVTSSTAVIWVRVSQTATVGVEGYYLDEGQPMTVTFPVSATATRIKDFTAKIRLHSLKPDTRYGYNVLIDGQKSLPFPHTFTTFPVEGQEKDFRFAILNDFAGVRPNAEKIRVGNWAIQEASAEHPSLMIIGGDFDHSDPTSTTVTATLEIKREMFRYLYACEPGKFAADFADSSCLLNDYVFSQYPVAHMWDDHDYGQNDGDRTYEYSRTSLLILDEYFPVYDLSPDGLTSQFGPDGDWQKFTYGHADFYLLDSRSQRDPNHLPDGPAKSMLGLRQRSWLLRELSTSEATWKFILTPSVFNPTSGKSDSWAWFGSERTRILESIEQEGITGVVMFSGDMHFGGVDDGTNAGVPEMIVPSLNRSCVTNGPLDRFPGIWSGGTYEADEVCQGYGVVEVFTNPHRLKLMVKDSGGTEKLRCTVHADGAADCAVPPAPMFMAYYTGIGTGAIRDALQTSDRSYVMVGNTLDEYGQSRALIAKVDERGSLEWATSTSEPSGSFHAVTTSAAGYVVIGNRHTIPDLSEAWLASFNRSGGFRLGHDLNASGLAVSLHTVFRRIGKWSAVTTVGGAIETGTGRDIYLSTLNLDDGSIENQMAYSIAAQIDSRYDIRATADMGFVLAGSDIVPATPSDGAEIRSDEQLLVIKLDSNLQPQWARLYGDPAFNERATSIVEMPGGGFVVVGSKESGADDGANTDAWVLRLDSAGHVLWQKAIGGPYDDHGTSVAPAYFDGEWGVMIAGQYAPRDGDRDIWLIRVDHEGTVLSQFAYGSENNEAPWFLHPTRDGGYISGGVWNAPGMDLAQGAPVLLKVDEAGSIPGCVYGYEPIYTASDTSSPSEIIAIASYPPSTSLSSTLPATHAASLTRIVACIHVDSNPAIAVAKTASVATAGMGQTITYTYRVTNSGDVNLYGVLASDDLLGEVALTTTDLAPDEWTIGTLTHIVVEDDLPGPLVNTVAVTGTPPLGNDVTASDDVAVQLISNPGLAVDKRASAALAKVGDTITYTYRLTNTGDVGLEAVTATDSALGVVPLDDTSLAPDEWTTGMLTYVVVKEDLPGPLTNTVAASGTPPDGKAVYATDEASVKLNDGFIIYLPLVVRNYP